MDTGLANRLAAARIDVAAVREGRVAEARLVIEGVLDSLSAGRIEGALALIEGVQTMRISCRSRTVWVVFDSTRVHEWQFERATRAMGHRLVSCAVAPPRPRVVAAS